MTDFLGQQIGTYRIVRLLGRGGFANVYLGEHVHLKTQAAIKVLRTQLTEEDNIDHFCSEARTIAHLVHPNIVRVLEFDVQDGMPFLVMDYAENGNLRQLYPRGTPLQIPDIIRYIKQISAALQYAHNQNVVHRDIKPENILLGRNNEILLSDFGIALVMESIREHTARYGGSEAAGTVVYMAPEQYQGRPSPASDQYSLAVMAYEWLCGTPPFQGTNTHIILMHIQAEPPPLREKMSAIPSDVERVIMTALSKDPQKRFKTVQAFANALEQAFLVNTAAAFLDGPSGRKEFSGGLKIGRAQDNDLILKDAKVSSHHAQILLTGQGYSIKDLGSTNRTYVNDEPLEPNVLKVLKSGDALRLGDTTLTFGISDTGSTGETSRVSDGSTRRSNDDSSPLPRPQTGPTPVSSVLPRVQMQPEPIAASSSAEYVPNTGYGEPYPGPVVVSPTPVYPPAGPVPIYAQQPPIQPAAPINPITPPPVFPNTQGIPVVGPQKKQSRRVQIIAALLVVCVIVASGAFFLIKSNTDNNARINAANATGTSQSLVRIHNQATAAAKASATAQVVASATALATSPYLPFTSLVFNDSLSTSDSQWLQDKECVFTGGSLQVSLSQQGYFKPCLSTASFADFAYQVNMTIVRGDCGGLLFRVTVSGAVQGFYVFEVCSDGSYNLGVFKANGNYTTLLASTPSSNIHKGINQNNLLAVVVQGSSISLYVNDRTNPVNTITDQKSTFKQGDIGVFADDVNTPTTVTFNNAFVWT
ncbi:MAG TPA: protein kinase [Ktedonobacteraceae bacterium]|jgi:serine/threonine protein kinase|nr:protein kinase [Ktedonobacteraceae bacterium]